MKVVFICIALLVCVGIVSALPATLLGKSLRVQDPMNSETYWELPRRTSKGELTHTLGMDSSDVSLVETGATTQAGKAMGPCKDCIFFLERVKKGTDLLLPSICQELYAMHGSDEGSAKEDFGTCEEVLQSVQLNGSNLKYWFLEGCYKYEKYQAKEWVHPCPSHVICATLKDLAAKPFCSPLPMEDPFAKK